ncbi:class A beta-lactamase-related serine hydrolase [Herbiconiux sp. CPCC 205763]|uniref:Class A beta-lactamase-related serine hydrolase n=1 Tax=Herbiconiux aconitum TaxID=2970913 RepID=A0ABT2GNI9_9MICO|nr:serine hydrolase [Herbiconiux aconitum]MCS5717789.1 class A beta-lactamase-related serine hydrolase [Herbiconiux aconitum]
MTPFPVHLVSTAPEHLAVAETIARDWESLGVSGHFLARNIRTGQQFGFDETTAVPIASVAKVPLALVLLDLIERGSIDESMSIVIDPATSSVGLTGLSAFRYPVTIAVADLLASMLSVSDNASGDALLDLVGIDAVNDRLREWGCHDIVFRHRFQRMYDCAAGAAGDDFRMAMELAIRGDRPGEHHAIETMDAANATVASAEALVDLLERVWLDRIADPRSTQSLRRLMSTQIFNHRLSSDLRAESYSISAKTGTFLNLRHEIGVVETDSADQIAIAALTRSTARATVQQDVDLAIGAAARSAVERLR